MIIAGVDWKTSSASTTVTVLDADFSGVDYLPNKPAYKLTYQWALVRMILKRVHYFPTLLMLETEDCNALRSLGREKPLSP